VARLQIFVKPGCWSCGEARRLGAVVAGLPHVDVEVIELGPERALPERVVAVPTYLLNGELVALGNPEPRVLLTRLATAVFTGRTPLLVASGALVASLLLSLILVLLGGLCLSAGTLQLAVPADPILLDVTGVVALGGAATLALAALPGRRQWLRLDEQGLHLGRVALRWEEVVAVEERGRTLVVHGRDGRGLRIAGERLGQQLYAELRTWLLALAHGGDPPASPPAP